MKFDVQKFENKIKFKFKRSNFKKKFKITILIRYVLLRSLAFFCVRSSPLDLTVKLKNFFINPI